MALNRYEVLERLSQLLEQDGVEPTSSRLKSIAVSHTVRELPEPSQQAIVEPKVSSRTLLLTVPEACAELRVSRAQLYILANKQRSIEMIHIGKLARIPRASLEDYVAALRQQNRLAFDQQMCA